MSVAMQPCRACGRPTKWDGDPAEALCVSCWDRHAIAETNREKVAKYRAANREKVAEYQRAYYAANREKLAEYQRAYYAANREKLAAQKRAYYEVNREKWRTVYAETRRSKRSAAS